jgi:anti-sigma factor RsiW
MAMAGPSAADADAWSNLDDRSMAGPPAPSVAAASASDLLGAAESRSTVRHDRGRLRAAVVMGGILIGTLSAAWQGRTLLAAAEGTATELVNEHLVATRMERLPVENGDPASVDAWFRDNVNYPVRSVASTPGGFRLYGGGLCAVFGEFAATAVYHGPNDSRASVFTFPEGDLRLPVARSVGDEFRGLSRGPYALVFTVNSGLVHAVVADVPLDELAGLAPYLITPDA